MILMLLLTARNPPPTAVTLATNRHKHTTDDNGVIHTAKTIILWPLFQATWVKWYHSWYFITLWLVVWHSGRMLVFYRWTFPVPHL